MIELMQITVKDYLELQDTSEYNFAMKFAFRFTDSEDFFKIGDVGELSFGLIKDFQYDLEKGIDFNKCIEYIALATKLDQSEIVKAPLDKFCRAFNYFKNSVAELTATEAQVLSHESTEEEIQAGLNRFDGLGIYLQIRALTNGDVTKFNIVRDCSYSLCFTELYACKQMADYQKELNRLQNLKK